MDGGKKAKQEAGKRIEEFWQTHGFPENDALAKKTGLTNLSRVKEGTIPRWEHLIEIAEACNSTLVELIKFVYPGAPEKVADIEIPPAKRPLFENLAAIVRVNNPRRILGIEVNLEEFAAQARAEEIVQSQERVAELVRQAETKEEAGNILHLEKKRSSKQRRTLSR